MEAAERGVQAYGPAQSPTRMWSRKACSAVKQCSQMARYVPLNMKGQKGGGGKVMDLPSPYQDVVKEGMLSCKTVLSDGKVCTLKYEGAEGGGGGGGRLLRPTQKKT